MADLTLYIGNKNYSSWSFRPWLGMKMANIKFEEILIPFDFPNDNRAIKDVSPTGKVPLLKDGSVLIAESLAILDHLDRKFPQAQLWPKDMMARSQAMAATCEMVSGFSHLRNQCPMNMRRPCKKLEKDPGLAKDVARIEQMWTGHLKRYGGPFLFGDFSIADAMFAPVVNRLDVYELTQDDMVLSYMNHMKSLDPWKEWEEAGRAEPWVVAEDEA